MSLTTGGFPRVSQAPSNPINNIMVTDRPTILQYEVMLPLSCKLYKP